MSLIEFAKDELNLLGYSEDSTDEVNRWIYHDVMELVTKFSEQGHSGTSANYVIGIVMKLLRFKPLTPLTGEDDEWSECLGLTGRFQNKRNSAVFKRKNGDAYWLDGRIFWEWYRTEDGEIVKTLFVNNDSKVPVTFPWTEPDPEYVFRPTEEFPNEVLES